MIQIKEITASQAYDIRKDLLRRNIALTEKIKGDFDNTTIHLGVFINNVLVSVATFLQNDHEYFNGLQYRLAGMATKDDFQKQGLGRQLLIESEKILKDKKVSILWCNARVVALDFYRKSGFATKGDEFDIPLIGGHYIMYKEL